MSRESRWNNPSANRASLPVQNSNENQNQNRAGPYLTANDPRTSAPPPAFRDQNWGEGGTANMGEEYQGSDGLTQENEIPREVMAESRWHAAEIPPISVAPPAQSNWVNGASPNGASTSETCTSENRGIEARGKEKRPSEEEPGGAKPYKCRFCQQTFSKSQALGGHMNRHRQERQTEQYDNALTIVHSRGPGPYPSSLHNMGPPPQMPPQFAANPTLVSWSVNPLLQSQLAAALQVQQGAYNHIPPLYRSNLGTQQGNLHGDLNALNIQNRQLPANSVNIPNSSQGWNRADMVPTTGDDRNQDSQPRHQPQLLHSDSKSGVGSNMQRNYLGQGMLSSSSSPVTVTEGDFSPSFQSRHNNIRMGTSDQSGSLLSNSPAHQTEHAASPNFTMPPLRSNHLANQRSYFASSVSSLQDFQNIQLPTYPSGQNSTDPINSIVNEESRLPNVSGTLTVLTRPSDPNSGVGASMQRNYPFSFRQGLSPSSSSPVAVTQGGFNTSIQRHNPTAPVNEESKLANVSDTLRALTPHSQFQAATRINSQDDINVLAGGDQSDNDIMNSDLPLISNHYMFGRSNSGGD